MSDANRYYLHSRMRYAILPFHKARARIKPFASEEIDTPWLNSEIDSGQGSPVGIGEGPFTPTLRERLRLLFASAWRVALYAPQSEVRILAEFEIRDRHCGLVPGVPLVARELPNHNQDEAQAFCDSLNAEYNKEPGFRRIR